MTTPRPSSKAMRQRRRGIFEPDAGSSATSATTLRMVDGVLGDDALVWRRFSRALRSGAILYLPIQLLVRGLVQRASLFQFTCGFVFTAQSPKESAEAPVHIHIVRNEPFCGLK